jgi:hypothetical protein
VATFAWLARFRADFERLTPEQQAAFLAAIAQFVADLRHDGRLAFRRALRVRGVQGAAGVFELTWAPDGRATFQYGDAVRAGEPHVIWRRVGTHAIFRDP